MTDRLTARYERLLDHYGHLGSEEAFDLLKSQTLGMSAFTFVLRRRFHRQRPRGAKLNRADRYTVHLLRRWGWSYADTALALGASESTVRRWSKKQATGHKETREALSNVITSHIPDRQVREETPIRS